MKTLIYWDWPTVEPFFSGEGFFFSWGFQSRTPTPSLVVHGEGWVKTLVTITGWINIHWPAILGYHLGTGFWKFWLMKILKRLGWSSRWNGSCCGVKPWRWPFFGPTSRLEGVSWHARDKPPNPGRKQYLSFKSLSPPAESDPQASSQLHVLFLWTWHMWRLKWLRETCSFFSSTASCKSCKNEQCNEQWPGRDPVVTWWMREITLLEHGLTPGTSVASTKDTTLPSRTFSTFWEVLWAHSEVDVQQEQWCCFQWSRPPRTCWWNPECQGK